MNASGVITATVATPPEYDNIVAFLFCFSFSVVGIAVNTTTGVVANRMPDVKSSFTQLNLSLVLADCGVLATFAFFFAPMMLLRSPLSASIVGYTWGQVSLLFWYVSLYALLAITVNRFVAVTKPLQYAKIFRDDVVQNIVIGCWVMGVLHSLLYFVPGCHFYLNADTWLFGYVDTVCGRYAQYTIDFGYAVSFFIVIFVINTTTYYKLRKNNMKTSSYGVNEEEAKRKKKREYRLFCHTFINAMVFETMLISFHVVSYQYKGKWFWFWSTTMFWVISHASNGFLFLIFNGPVRRSVFLFLTSGKIVDVPPSETQTHQPTIFVASYVAQP